MIIIKSKYGKIKMAKNMEVDKVIYLTEDYVDKTPEGEVLDKLQLIKMCCRRHLLTHVDID
jgi:DNA-directed RNA polymerase subunit N (RpoN/RPB10)